MDKYIGVGGVKSCFNMTQGYIGQNHALLHNVLQSRESHWDRCGLHEGEFLRRVYRPLAFRWKRNLIFLLLFKSLRTSKEKSRFQSLDRRLSWSRMESQSFSTMDDLRLIFKGLFYFFIHRLFINLILLNNN